MLRRLVRTVGPLLLITLVTLVAFDLLCNVLGLFRPKYLYGDRDLGWLAAPHRAAVYEDRCTQLESGRVIKYARNEDGIRTAVSAAQLVNHRGELTIAVTGDSQTDLCAPNSETHPGILESELRASGTDAIVLAYAMGRYSPLQDYVAYKKFLRKYNTDAYVLNFYTGNDFNDLLRVDDRPHFVKTAGGYRIAEPVWYRYDAPGVERRSRLIYLAESMLRKTAIPDLTLRLRLLSAAAAAENKGIFSVLAYMNDLRRASEPSLVYGDAFAAQMLNQQLYFHHFPRSREESVNRVQALLGLVRAENPHTLLALSAVPSYQLVQQQPVHPALLSTFARLPITYEDGVRQERELYEMLRGAAFDTGWAFVDNLAAMQEYRGGEQLFNHADFHLLPPASRIIGQRQAETIRELRRSREHQANVIAAH